MKSNIVIALAGILSTGMMSVSCENGTDTGIPVAGVALDVNSAIISPLETLELTAVVEPQNADDKTLEWTSDDLSVATVDEDGVVTPAGAFGTAKITVRAGDRTDICTVTVDRIGTAGFRTEKTWAVDNAAENIHQIWSDVVMATGARKSTFDGGHYIGSEDYEWRVDCRENPGYGDCFSWQAIVDYGDRLCPEPWQVPTKEDFWALDKALGGPGQETGTAPYFDETILAKYLNANRWGGEYGGQAYADQLIGPGANAFYATRSEAAQAYGEVLTYAHVLFLRSDANAVRPVGNEPKFNGWPVRCVKMAD